MAKRIEAIGIAILAGVLADALPVGCATTPVAPLAVSSPNGRIAVVFTLRNGVPFYEVDRDDRAVVERSKLGFVFKEQGSLNRDLRIRRISRSRFDEEWEQPWGEVQTIRNHYNELRVELEERTAAKRRMNVIFRVFDDGVGFRYELPEQEQLSGFEIMDEQTEFALSADHRAWWIPALWDNRYEYLYERTPVSELEEAVHTPLTLEATGTAPFVSIHEAALTDYASMVLRHTSGTTLECELVPWSDGTKVKGQTPLVTPWRTIQIADRAGDLITSYLILNLNEPNKLGDVSWVKPGKYVGIWWGMHLDTMSWESGHKHGATTERAKQYIDFASDHGISGVLVEGWNIGWDGDWMSNSDLFQFTTPYPDFDIDEVARYAASKDVRLIGHHETSAGIGNYERQLDDAFRFYRELGVDTIKTGYVGTRVHSRSGDEWHHGQYMVRHYRMVVEKAAEYGIMLDVHEPIKDTGIRRTYPNMMTREGARGMEYDAWGENGGNPPRHHTILPFTRGLSGPFDFTPGIFDLLYEEARPDNRSNTTLAKQLAFYVVIYSPLQMAADLVENYDDHPAFQFIEDVPVDWKKTVVLDAKIGETVTIARQDRHSTDWYIGSIANAEPHALDVELDFLPRDREYVAEIYRDGPGADWKSKPYALEIVKEIVDAETTLQLRLASGGGQAIRLRPASPEDVRTLPRHAASYPAEPAQSGAESH